MLMRLFRSPFCTIQELREEYFEVQQDFDGTTAVEVSLAATGFVSYYKVNLRPQHLYHANLLVMQNHVIIRRYKAVMEFYHLRTRYVYLSNLLRIFGLQGDSLRRRRIGYDMH